MDAVKLLQRSRARSNRKFGLVGWRQRRQREIGYWKFFPFSLVLSPLWSPPPPMALSATELLPVTTVEASGSLVVSMLPPPFPESSSLSWSFIMCLAVMASTLDRFRFRLPSELGWAPGKRLEEVTDEEPASDADASADDGALADAARMMDVEASFGGLGVP